MNPNTPIQQKQRALAGEHSRLLRRTTNDSLNWKRICNTDWHAYNNTTITLTGYIVFVNLLVVQKHNPLAILSGKSVNRLSDQGNQDELQVQDKAWFYMTILQTEPKSIQLQTSLVVNCLASITSLILWQPDLQPLDHQHYSDGRGDSKLELAAQPCSRTSFSTPSSTPAQYIKISCTQIADIQEFVDRLEHEVGLSNQATLVYRKSTVRETWDETVGKIKPHTTHG